MDKIVSNSDLPREDSENKSKSSSIENQNWQYVAEGHLNVAFTNQNGKILRLRKQQKHIKKSKYNDDFFTSENSCMKEKRSNSNNDKIKHYLIIPNVLQTYRYINLVVKELMPEQWLPSVELFETSKFLFENLTAKTDTKIDVSEKYMLMMDDCAHIIDNDTIGIEIKPKCGVAFDDSCGSCRFCLQQRLKVDTKQRSEISKYCPLNFYSNSYSRFHRAICGMISTPHNNLRIFSGSLQFYGDGDSSEKFDEVLNTIGLNSVEEFSYLLWNILYDKEVQEFPSKSYCDAHKDISKDWNFAELRSQETRNSSFLDCILRLQNFDKLGSIRASEIYSDLSIDEETLLSDFDESFWKQVVERMKHQCSRNSKQDLQQTNDNVSLLAEYLISSTFKDCSIFISIQKNTNQLQKPCKDDCKRFMELEINGVSWLVKLSLVDFDPKPLGKIARYKKLHEDILRVNGLQQSSIILV